MFVVKNEFDRYFVKSNDIWGLTGWTKKLNEATVLETKEEAERLLKAIYNSEKSRVVELDMEKAKQMMES